MRDGVHRERNDAYELIWQFVARSLAEGNKKQFYKAVMAAIKIEQELEQ